MYGIQGNQHLVSALRILQGNYKQIFGNQELLQKRVATLSKLHQKAVKEGESRQASVASLRGRNEQLSRELGECKKQLEDAVERARELQMRNKALSGEKKQMSAEKSGIEDRLRRLESELGGLEASNGDLMREMEKLVEINRKQEQSLAQEEEKRRKSGAELEEARFKLKQLKRAEDFMTNPIYTDQRENMKYLDQIEEIQKQQTRQIRDLQEQLEKYKSFYQQKTFMSVDKKKPRKAAKYSRKLAQKMLKLGEEYKAMDLGKMGDLARANSRRNKRPQVRNFNIVSDAIFRKMNAESEN